MEFNLKKKNKKGDKQNKKTWKHSASETEANALRAMLQKSREECNEKLSKRKDDQGEK